MDPVSQGALGASLPQAFAKDGKRQLHAGIAGFLAGMLPDVDVFIRSSRDPLLFLEYHRQFTHALVFIPVGGLIAALALFPFFRKHLRFRALFVFTTLGYGTHGLLDACTSYGTQLFWPFSDYRVAWNNVSIVDPLFTLPLLILVVLAAAKRRRLFARVGFAWALLYLSLGVLQHERALSAGEALARRRGHDPVRLEAKPTLGNLLLWKLLYETDGRFYVDAVRVAAGVTLYEGESIEKLVPSRDLPWLSPGTLQHDDVERFTWFSDGWVSLHPTQDAVVGDVRYSFLPNEVDPMWGIRLEPTTPREHAEFENFRDGVAAKQRVFLRMIFGAAD